MAVSWILPQPELDFGAEPPLATTPAMISARSLFSRGSMAWVSGSPMRQLNSITMGPSSVSISPAYRTPVYGHPSAANAAAVGSMIRVRTWASSSPVQKGGGL